MKVYQTTIFVLGLRILLQYYHKDYFINNLEKYEINIDSKAIDYVITTNIDSVITLHPDHRHIIFSKTKEGQMRSVLTIHENQYDIHLLDKTIKNVAEAEYVYMGIAFMELCLKEGLLPLHASTILYQGDAIAFSAPSNTGKSTHASLWEKYIPDARKLNDDKTILTLDKQNVMARGIPFSGAKAQNINDKGKLKAIVFLKQAKDNHMRKMNKEESIKAIVKNIYRPTLESQWSIVLDQVANIVASIPIYELEANVSEDAVQTVYQALYEEVNYED